METYEKLGAEIAKGLILYLGKWIGIILIITFCVSWFVPKDSTDPVNGRSGLKLYTDSLTRVQYIGSKHGLTVRIDGAGNPILAPPDKER